MKRFRPHTFRNEDVRPNHNKLAVSQVPRKRGHISIHPWQVPVRSVHPASTHPTGPSPVHSPLRLQPVIISEEAVRRSSTMSPVFASQLLVCFACFAAVFAGISRERLVFDPEHPDTCFSEVMGEMKKDELKFNNAICIQAACSITENGKDVPRVQVVISG
ncbi:unnamed protein product [Darwinula stevensoni]|uniref:Uncharacterized protein n=1 Tax=Darwinula stevensoni TaxID=69355 RepID=A0A7R9AFM8_9CRUS|nr:unnamed protein product [Darwinula stevensoni]CAG0903000.1 unnamed protein product [Darwinula stevensoni]